MIVKDTQPGTIDSSRLWNACSQVHSVEYAHINCRGRVRRCCLGGGFPAGGPGLPSRDGTPTEDGRVRRRGPVSPIG